MPIFLTAYIMLLISRSFWVIKPRAAFIIFLLSIVTALIRINELSLSEMILSVNPIFSIGSTALITALLWEQIFGSSLLTRRDILLFSIWNVLTSVCLYASTLGYIAPDKYVLGYEFSSFFILVMVVSIALALLKNPLAYIFLAYIAAFDLRLLPTENFFDYIIDGFLFLISIGIIVREGIFKLKKSQA